MKEDSTNVSPISLYDLAQLALSSLTFTSAEERLVKEIDRGDPIVFTSGDSKKNNPGNAGSWGEVRLLGATIGGSLDCSEGQFINKEGDALSGDGVQIIRSLFRKGYIAFSLDTPDSIVQTWQKEPD